jgi:tRNA (cmo5U34)-methyltransferase
MKQRLDNSEIMMWGCFHNDRIIGMIATKPPSHISLLFVDKQYHRQGIARALYQKIIEYYSKDGGCTEITVYSSLYAVEAYKRLGFVATDTEQQKNGIRFVPMKHIFKKQGTIFNTSALEEMSDFFNSRAQIYEEKHLEHVGGMESKQIIASFFPPHAKTMIDLGIGTGLELDTIFKRFPEIEVTGLDIAEDMLKLLIEKYPDRKINLYCESYLNYDFGNCLYDVALSVMTLHHYNHQTKTDLYRRIHQSLNHNGVYIECDYMLSEHEYENPQEQEDFYFSEFERLKKEQGIADDREYHYDTPCMVSNQKKMLLEAGFTSVKEVWRQKDTVILVAYK